MNKLSTGIVCLIVGLIFGSIGLFSFMTSGTYSEKAGAIITDIDARQSNYTEHTGSGDNKRSYRGIKTTYTCEYEYKVGEVTTHGSTICGELKDRDSKININHFSKDIGDSATIYYNPDEPSKISTSSPGSKKIIGVLMFVAGLSLLGFGGFTLAKP